MNKKKVIALVLGAMLTAGIAFNFATTANYTQKFDTVTQTVNSATWSVDMDTNGDENDNWNHTIFPGDVIGNDTITLTNANNYPVMFNVKLSTDNTGKLNDALELQLLNGDKATGVVNPDGTVNVLVEGVKDGEESNNVVLTSKVSWASVNADIDRENAGKSVIYKYDVAAEAMSQIKNVVTVTTTEGLMEALDKLQPNTLLSIKSGNYDLSKTVGRFRGSSFIIDKDNVYIRGEAAAVIYAESNAPNGGLLNGITGQNTIYVSGNNVTLDSLTIMPIQSIDDNTNQYNKAIEVIGKDTFTMRNCTIIPNTNISGANAVGYGGQVSFNMPYGTKETVKVENNTFNGAVLDPRTAITATNNTFNGASPVHKTAVRFRYQQPEGKNLTYTSYLNNNIFNNIAEGHTVLRSNVGNIIIMTENRLPKVENISSLLDLNRIDASHEPGTAVIDGVEYKGN